MHKPNRKRTEFFFFRFEEGEILLGAVPDAKQRVIEQDPLTTTNLHSYFIQKLKETEQSLGSSNFQQLIQSISAPILQQLQDLERK